VHVLAIKGLKAYCSNKFGLDEAMYELPCPLKWEADPLNWEADPFELGGRP